MPGSKIWIPVLKSSRSSTSSSPVIPRYQVQIPADTRRVVSQNHRMFGVGRDLCGSSSPTPLPKQGHLQQAAEDLVQEGLEYLQRRRLHNLPGQYDHSDWKPRPAIPPSSPQIFGAVSAVSQRHRLEPSVWWRQRCCVLWGGTQCPSPCLWAQEYTATPRSLLTAAC